MKKWSNLDFLQVNAMSDELGEVTTIIDLVINFLAFGTQLLGLQFNFVSPNFKILYKKISVSKHCALGSKAWSRL